MIEADVERTKRRFMFLASLFLLGVLVLIAMLLFGQIFLFLLGVAVILVFYEVIQIWTEYKSFGRLLTIKEMTNKVVTSMLLYALVPIAGAGYAFVIGLTLYESGFGILLQGVNFIFLVSYALVEVDLLRKYALWSKRGVLLKQRIYKKKIAQSALRILYVIAALVFVKLVCMA